MNTRRRIECGDKGEHVLLAGIDGKFVQLGMDADICASARLVAQMRARKAVPDDVRAAAEAALNAQLRACLKDVAGGVLAFYWPIQAEFDARPAVTDWLAGGDQPNGKRRAVLPVVIGKHQPLRFRAWQPATVMQAAGFGTSVQSTGEWLVPTVLLIPLVGFDDAGYRLGYGGGYYDRTLAALQPGRARLASAMQRGSSRRFTRSPTT